MKISFVLPVYNQQATIRDCLHSLLNQTYKNTELIVIDDGSTDETKDIIEFMLKGKRNTIKIFENKRRGAAIRRNEGNIIASGDIIAVCDCDQYYKDRADVIIEAFSKDKDLGVFYSSARLKCAKTGGYAMHDAIKWDFKSKCPICHPTIAYKKELSIDTPYYETTIDSDLYEFMLIDMYKKGIKFNGCQVPTITKIEGNSNRKAEEVKKLKKLMYTNYDIKVDI